MHRAKVEWQAVSDAVADLILVTEVLARATTFALIDRQARKGEKPSDHTPVLLDVDVPAGVA